MTNEPVNEGSDEPLADVAEPQQPPPGGAGFPPPGGFPPPPPGTAGYAARYGLVRPLEGRYIAGVCAALGRATNTDPVLWRVALPVLTVLGGLGGLLYVLGWLLIPAEGDTGSPIEALVGRGYSSTSRVLTVVLTVIAAFGLIGGLTNGIGGRFLALAAIVGGLVLFATSRNNPTPPWRQVPNPPGVPGYRPPFAPYGPYAGPTPYAGTPYAGPAQYAGAPYATHEFPGLATMAPVVPAPPPPVRRQPTPARLITLSCVLLAVGILGAADLAGIVSVPASAYFAVALATVGLGMIIGSLFGRVRGPITLGILLTVGLMVSTAIGGLDHHKYSGGHVTWRPASLAELQSGYTEQVGRLTVDLSEINFTGAERTVFVKVNVGNVVVILPANVDTTVDARVGIGSTHAFGKDRGGINASPWVISDNGDDGPGGGQLRIDARVNIGDVEVRR